MGEELGWGQEGQRKPRLWVCQEQAAHSHGCISLACVGLSHMASLLGRESSVVGIHASNAGCFWGTEVPGCCFWLTCEVLCGIIQMLTGSCSGARTEALERF